MTVVRYFYTTLVLGAAPQRPAGQRRTRRCPGQPAVSRPTPSYFPSTFPWWWSRAPSPSMRRFAPPLHKPVEHPFLNLGTSQTLPMKKQIARARGGGCPLSRESVPRWQMMLEMRWRQGSISCATRLWMETQTGQSRKQLRGWLHWAKKSTIRRCYEQPGRAHFQPDTSMTEGRSCISSATTQV